MNEAFSKKFEELVLFFSKSEHYKLIEKANIMLDEYPNCPKIMNILGATYASIGDTEAAISFFRKSEILDSENINTLKNLAQLNFIMKNYIKSLYYYRRIKSKIEDDFFMLSGMATCLGELNQLDEAIDLFRRVLALSPSFADAHNNLGKVLQQRGDLNDAILAYKRALSIEPDNIKIWTNIGIAYMAKGDFPEAMEAHRSALRINPNNLESYCHIGRVYFKRGKINRALSWYRRALNIQSDCYLAYKYLGECFVDQGEPQKAVSAYRRALDIMPDDAKSELTMLHQMRHMCDWGNHANIRERYAQLGVETDAVEPFPALSMEDHPHRQLLRAQKFATKTVGTVALPQQPTRPASRERIRIGYFSSDLHEAHPCFQLFAGVPREHDKSEFELYGYDYSGEAGGERKHSFKQNFTEFHVLNKFEDEKLFELARSHQLDIAVDLNGFTKSGKWHLFGRRLAPIQINFLGYPGTMGAKFMDYIIADSTLITNNKRKFYSESIIYLPDSYQPNDIESKISDIKTCRSDFGLPEDSFVFCCFNNNYKISPWEFDIWMRLLARIKGSVLWLIKSNRWTEGNLRQEAAVRGINPERIVFAERWPNKSDHLARHKHADLFLDTFNFNAHTTASDALWAGLPVLTRKGEQFAARVAASLLNAVDLPELVTSNDQDYEALAFDLATNSDKLQRIKKKLEFNRLNKPLFDTAVYTRNLEAGLREAYKINTEGKRPRDIRI